MDQLHRKIQQAASLGVEAQRSEQIQREIQASIQRVYHAIDRQQKELIPIYRDLKYNAEHRGGDQWILGVNASKVSEEKQKDLEQEVLHIKRRFDYPVLAKKLLQELQAYQQELDQVLAARNETCLDYGRNPIHEDDFENDYSSQELAAYIANYGIDSAQAQQEFLKNNWKNCWIAALEHHTPAVHRNKLQQIFRSVSQKTVAADQETSMLEEAFKKAFIEQFVAELHDQLPSIGEESGLYSKLLEETHEQTLQIWRDVTSKEQAFIGGLRYLLEGAPVDVWKQAGSSETLKAAVVKQLLRNLPLLRQHITVCYPLMHPRDWQPKALAHMSRLVIQALWMALDSPLNLLIQQQTMREIKKQVHRLRLAIQDFIQQPEIFLTEK